MPEMDYSLLRRRMAVKGWTQKALADRIGINRASLCQKLNGRVPFKIPEIAAICIVLEIHADEISLYFFTAKAEKTQLS